MTGFSRRLVGVLTAGCLLFFGLLVSLESARPVTAADPTDSSEICGGEGRYFLGIPSWDRGVGDCEDIAGEEIISGNKLVIVATNIATIVTHLSAIIAIGFIIYGGFLFALSGGNMERATDARKTVINAAIGAIIAIMGRVIAEVIYNNLTQ